MIASKYTVPFIRNFLSARKNRAMIFCTILAITPRMISCKPVSIEMAFVMASEVVVTAAPFATSAIVTVIASSEINPEKILVTYSPASPM